MSKTLESPVSSMRRAAGARTTILVTGFLGALIAEHAQALTSTATAALPRKRLTDLRAIYTAPNAKRGSTAAEDSLTKAFKSPAMTRRLVTGFNVVAALVIAWCLIALVAA